MKERKGKNSFWSKMIDIVASQDCPQYFTAFRSDKISMIRLLEENTKEGIIRLIKLLILVGIMLIFPSFDLPLLAFKGWLVDIS